MNFIKVIILGLVQGLTEFLPVSSSAHLVIFQSILGVEKAGITLEVFLHFGTLIAVFIVFWQDIIDIITFKPQCRRFTIYIALGTIPALVSGLLFEERFEKAFSDLRLVGFMLLVTGLLLWLSDRVRVKERVMQEMNWSDSLVVGFAQAFAIFPGISRSGSTIVGGLFKGLDRKLAAKYSFLLSIPVIGGATILESIDLMKEGMGDISFMELGIGTFISMVSGYFAIKLLLKVINKERLSLFAYYCWLLGFITILLN
ncbi:undecaprenyl-diphosphatase UppP [Halonatronum saccharophilum]|uniref:undecaprenyl-diphosphatase UppP n=1 Tax=Halonatronum saccharophilum TaxID=150060 RepID=UPI0004842AC3|nr:undecaprenyl-diphosphatase UppP [Halonatronum saccharophilum]